MRRHALKRKYGITPELYARMLADQGGGCAICETTAPGGRGRFHVDHDHASGRVRGLLRHGCNTAIGGLGEDLERMRRAIAYIERGGAKTR